MKFKRNLKSEVGIDLTSLIDVVFLLLIFFMVTTTFTRQSNLLINLPEANGTPAEEPGALHIEILVARDGSYTVNGRALTDNSFTTLTRSLEELSAGDVNIPVTLTADADTSHQSVVTALDAVAQLGISRLSVATRRRGEN